MNKKNVLPLAALAGAALVLVVIYVFLQVRQKQTPDGPGDFTTEYFEAVLVDTSKIDRIVIQNDKFEGAFYKEGENWKHEGEEFFPVKQKVFDNLFSILLSHLNAFSVLEKPAELSQYGLDNPKGQLRLYQGEQELIAISLGDRLPTQEMYYCKFSGDDKVYTVSTNYHRFLTMAREDFLEELNLPQIADTSQLLEIQVCMGDAVMHAVHDENNPYDYSGKNVFDWYFLEPYGRIVNADFDTWHTQCENYLQFSYHSLVDYMPASLARYGLEEPEGKLTVTYRSQNGQETASYTILLGAKDEKGDYYVKLQGSDWIMTMAPEIVEMRFATDTYPWVYKNILWPGVQVLETVTITSKDFTHVLSIETVTGEDGGQTAQGLWDNQLLTKEDFTLVQSALLNLQIVALAKEEISSEDAVLTITVKVRDEDKQKNQTIAFLPYNTEAYAISVDGQVDFVIDKRKVEAFLLLWQ